MLIMAIPGIVEDWEGTRGEGQVDRLQHWRWKKCERWSSIIVSAAKFQLYVLILDPWTRMKRVCWFLSVPHWSWQIQEEGLGEPSSTWYLVLCTWYLALGSTWYLSVPDGSRHEQSQEERLGKPGEEIGSRRQNVPLLSHSQWARAQTFLKFKLN